MPGAIPEPMELLFSFYQGLHRKAPGGEASTRKALSLLADLPEGPRFLDLGCGSGASSLVLAERPDAEITALDLHGPFLWDLLRRAAQAKTAGRITTIRADLARPPFVDRAFDVVWSEGAIYLVGFEEGLVRWRRLLKPRGYIAVSEVSWLVDDPPQAAVEFWDEEYPAITSVRHNVESLRSAGFDLIDTFVLPPEDWARYLEPVEAHLEVLRVSYPNNPDAQALEAGLRREIGLWRRYGSSYGYVFYVGRLPRTAQPGEHAAAVVS